MGALRWRLGASGLRQQPPTRCPGRAFGRPGPVPTSGPAGREVAGDGGWRNNDSPVEAKCSHFDVKVTHTSRRDRCRTREPFFWSRQGPEPPRRSPTGRLFAAGFGVRAWGCGGRADSGPSWMKVRSPGPGRRNRGWRLASSTPATRQDWAGARSARRGATRSSTTLAAAGQNRSARRPPRSGRGASWPGSVQSAAPPGCGARPAALRPGGALLRQPRTARTVCAGWTPDRSA